jgi:hypothetical protein
MKNAIYKLVPVLVIVFALSTFALITDDGGRQSSAAGTTGYYLDDSTHTLTITGGGPMDDYSSPSDQPWASEVVWRIIILDGVTHIGNNAFADLVNVTSVEAADTVWYIGNYAFRNCSSLVYVDIAEATFVGEYAFSNVSSLKTVSLPKVTAVGPYVFENCYSLEYVDLSRLAVISEHMFDHCIALDNIDAVIVTKIDQYAFYYCKALTSIDFPILWSVGNNAFDGCQSLRSVSLPDVTVMGDSVFKSCYALSSVNIPLVTEMGVGVFGDCYSLAHADMRRLEKIADNAFYNCYSLTSIDVPQVTTIGHDAFYDCSALVSVTAPLVTEISYSAFLGCTALTSIDFPKLETIGDRAFYDCTALSSITIPDTVTAINPSAFQSCTGMVSIIFDGSVMPVFGDDSLSFGSSISPVTVRVYATFFSSIPSNAYDIYTILVPGPVPPVTGSGTYNSLTWDLDAGGRLLIMGNGELPHNYSDAPWYPLRDHVISLDISTTNTTSIPDSAFFGYHNLTSVVAPISVTAIGSRAFEECYHLASVSILGVEKIGNKAFFNCYSLTSANFPELREIDKSAFQQCTALTSVYFPELREIGESAFQQCTALTSIYFPKLTDTGYRAFSDCRSLAFADLPALTYVNGYMFAWCYALSSVYIPNVETVVDNAFYYCKALTSIDFPKLTVTGNSVFSRCYSLASINIPEIIEVGYRAFYECYALSFVYLPKVEGMGSNAFYGCTSLTLAVVSDSAPLTTSYAFESVNPLFVLVHYRGADSVHITDVATELIEIEVVPTGPSGLIKIGTQSSYDNSILSAGSGNVRSFLRSDVLGSGNEVYVDVTADPIDIVTVHISASGGTVSWSANGSPYSTDVDFSVPRGTNVIFAGVPVEYYGFDMWTSVGSNGYRTAFDRVDPYSTVIDHDTTVYAAFEQAVRPLTVDISGGGYVEYTYGGTTYTLTSTGTILVPVGITSVNLTAVPNTGSMFYGWEEVLPIPGLLSGDSIDVLSPYGEYRASFSPGQCIITSSADSNSTITPEGPEPVTYGESATFMYSAKSGYVISQVLVDGLSVAITGSYIFNNVIVDHEISVISVALPQFTVTSSADGNSVITPEGSQAVPQGGNATFTYYAKPGYRISEVLVDGSSVPTMGSYTFANVRSGHTISVASVVADQLTVTATVEGGKGHTEYHTAGTQYATFTVVTVSAGSDVYIRIIPADGYEFVNWTGSFTFSGEEIHIANIETSISLVAHLKATGSGEDSGHFGDISVLLPIVAIILLIVGIFWFLFVARRSYEVVKTEVEGMTINGKNRAIRRSVYRFTVEGDDTGIKYRIGEGDWKQPIKTEDGYEIPKEDVTDKVTITAD